MTREEVFAKVTEIFKEVFDDDSLEITDETSAKDIEEWDSLMHITLISTMEEEFGISFKLKEVTSLENVGMTVDLIFSKVSRE